MEEGGKENTCRIKVGCRICLEFAGVDAVGVGEYAEDVVVVVRVVVTRCGHVGMDKGVDGLEEFLVFLWDRETGEWYNGSHSVVLQSWRAVV